MAPVDPLTGVEASRFGLYVHFPYCLAKCPYCDFAVAVAREIPQERYTRALIAELGQALAARPALRGRALDSIFLGGGTPSLWEPPWVEQLLSAAARAFRLAAGVEISLEANPEALDGERLRGYRSAGVGRLSLGVQSFQPEVLRRLGRAHGPREARAAVEAARRAGFDNISLDLIYAAPGQTHAQVLADAQAAVELAPEHVSAYALTVDRPVLAEETPMARQVRRGELALPDDDAQVAMADALDDLLARGGLVRYEVSNRARPGLHSRHNALYWTGGEYLGLGVGAAGLLRDNPRSAVRAVNLRSPERFLAELEAGRPPVASTEALGPPELFAERLAMGLRLVAGVELAALAAAYGQGSEGLVREAEALAKGGFATLREGRFALTRKGLHLHSEVAARLLARVPSPSPAARGGGPAPG